MDIVTAGPSAKGLKAEHLKGPVFCVNHAAKLFECDWLCYHGEDVHAARYVPRKGYITSGDVMARDFGAIESIPAGRQFIETARPWNLAFNYSFPIMLATILVRFNPARVWIHGLDMTLTEEDCAGTKSGSRTDPLRWERELQQLEKVWSPVIAIDESSGVSDEVLGRLKFSARFNGRWHDG